MNETIPIALTMAEWQLVLNEIAKGRYIDVVQVIDKIAAQIRASQEKKDAVS